MGEERKLVYETCPFCGAVFSHPISFDPSVDDQTLLTHIETVHKSQMKMGASASKS